MTRHSVLAILLSVPLASSLTLAQTSTQSAAARTPAPASTPGQAASAKPAAALKVESNLAQLMRGMLYPASNVVFAAQTDLSRFKPDPMARVSRNLLTSTFGGWEA